MELKLDKEKILIGIIIFLLVVIIGGVGYLQAQKVDSGLALTPSERDNPTDKDQKIDEYIYVHVSGQVISPGVYKLPKGARVHQAIDLAGGPTLEGDLQKLNLAQMVSDGQKITVPSVHEEVITEPNQQINGKININAASKESLETLPGIGPAKAIAIISYREQNGPFGKIEDIQKVSGIGPATFNQIKDLIIVN